MNCVARPIELTSGLVDMAVNSFAFSLSSPLIVPGIKVLKAGPKIVSGPYNVMGRKHTAFYQAFAKYRQRDMRPGAIWRERAAQEVRNPWIEMQGGGEKRFSVKVHPTFRIKEKTVFEINLPSMDLGIFQSAGQMVNNRRRNRKSDYGFTAVGVKLLSGVLLYQIAEQRLQSQDPGPGSQGIIDSLGEDKTITPLTAYYLALLLENDLMRKSHWVDGLNMFCEAVRMPYRETIGSKFCADLSLEALRKVDRLSELLMRDQSVRLIFYKDFLNSRGNPHKVLEVNFSISTDESGAASPVISITQRGFYHNSNGKSRPPAQGIVDFIQAAVMMYPGTFPLLSPEA